MKYFTITLGIILLGFAPGCKSKNTTTQPNFYDRNDSINLYAFVGEKISITPFNPNENTETIKFDSITGFDIITKNITMDAGFKAKYKVLKNVFNELRVDTIEFEVYDHYGRPSFEKYKNVLIYISLDKEKGTFYQQKYQYNPVKIKDRRWKGLKGESIESLFMEKRNGVLKARGIFK